MKRKKQKGYWVKRTERFQDGSQAKSRAAELRQHKHISHVIVQRTSEQYEVSYAVAKFYLEELERAGLTL